PADYYPVATLMGCFQGGGIKGKIQLGSAWWFCDHIEGMEQQIKTLGALGMIHAFVGKLTDSRSFLSYPRHEYVRRILCNILGDWVERGLYPADRDGLARIVKGVSFGNAKAYFG
ncbi:MAG: glucuronate isomerase, partial [Treponema sp.]|nr:glucuronate isomerase [Treponema sp.]